MVLSYIILRTFANAHSEIDFPNVYIYIYFLDPVKLEMNFCVYKTVFFNILGKLLLALNKFICFSCNF